MTKSAAASPDAPPADAPPAAEPAETTAAAAPAAETAATPAAAPAATPPVAPAAETAAAPAAETAAAPAAAPAPGVIAKTSDLTAGPGGVMTDEVGVVTGDLTLRSELDGTALTLRVQYKDADEWYKVTGGKATLKDADDLEAVHKIAVGILNRPEG